MNQNGTVASTVPVGVDAVNVDFSDGKTLVQELNLYTTKIESNVFKNAIVEVFDPNKAYDKGTCVLNDVNDGGDGKVYKLTAAHASGVAWKNTQKVATVISKQLRGGITIDITNHALVIE